MRRRPGDAQDGFSLVMVLWITTVLAIQVSLLHVSVRDASSLASNQLASARGEALAAAGVEIAAAHLIETDPGRRWRADGVPRQISLSGARLTIAVRDESARIDINAADADMLRGLLRPHTTRSATLDQWVDRILDWRDADSERRQHGAEAADYRRAGEIGGPRNGPFLPANGPFLDVSELGRVLGFPPEVAQALAPLITVHGGDGKINPRVASREVLVRLPGADRAEIDRYIALRQRGDAAALDIANVLASIRKWLSDRTGPAYRIEVAVQDETGAAMSTLEAVILLGRDATTPYRVLSWRQDPKVWHAPGRGQER